jgi:hypothetical protein
VADLKEKQGGGGRAGSRASFGGEEVEVLCLRPPEERRPRPIADEEGGGVEEALRISMQSPHMEECGGRRISQLLAKVAGWKVGPPDLGRPLSLRLAPPLLLATG